MMRGGILKNFDQPLLIITSLFVLLGFLSLASASLGLFENSSTSPWDLLARQLILGLGIGGIAFFVGAYIPYQFWRKNALLIFLITFFLTYLVFVPGLGFGHGGAMRWISIGPIFFQPGEFLKLGFLIYLAAWLSSRQNQVKSIQFGLVPFLVMISLIGLVFVLQPDIGTLGVIIITSLILFFIAGGRLTQVGLIGVFGLLVLSFLILIEPYRLTRILVFLNPGYDSQGAGYQIKQALIALGSGGLFGRGFGKSLQKFSYLPEPMGDSIFAVIGEEFGFLGTSFLIGLFLFFLWRGVLIAKNAKDDFAKLLGAGIVVLIVIQSFINIGALSGILPLTGIPLVFVSQGASSLVVSLAGVGILMNIARQNKKRL